MEQVEFICDDGTVSLVLQCRNPADLNIPAQNIRLRIQCSDCAAGLTVDAQSFAGFVELFRNPPAVDASPMQWASPAGEWLLTVSRSANGFTFTSYIDSLLDIHRWKLETSFQMNEDCFQKLAENVRQFIGVCQ